MNKNEDNPRRVWSVVIVVDLVWGSGGCVYRAASLGATGGNTLWPLFALSSSTRAELEDRALSPRLLARGYFLAGSWLRIYPVVMQTIRRHGLNWAAGCVVAC